MTVEALRQPLHINLDVDATGLEADEGIFMGHVVEVDVSPVSLLAEAAEEMSFCLDCFKDFALQQRKQREGSTEARRLSLRYRGLMRELGKSSALDQVIEELADAADHQTVLERLGEAFRDPTDMWTALIAALDRYENDADMSAEQKRMLEETAQDYFDKHAKDIKLGLHGALAAHQFPELGSVESSRDLYRNCVGDFSSVTEVFEEIVRTYGERFDKAMDFLFSAISTDIASCAPSTDRVHLENVHEKLGLVRLTQSAHALCEQLLERWKLVHHVTPGNLSAMQLLGEILGLRDKAFADASAVQAIVLRAEAPDIEHEVLFVQDLLSTMRKFPDALFDNETKRMNVLQAVQQAVDAAIEREDQYLASLE